MNLEPREIAVLATLVAFLLVFFILYLRVKSTLNTTLLINEQAAAFNNESLENKNNELNQNK